MKGNNADNHGKRFVNPYNFIPLMDKCERLTSAFDSKDCYTGYFDCELKLLTPLFIPNTSSSSRLLTESEKQNEEDRKENWRGDDFFSYDDWSAEKPVKSVGNFPMPPKSPVIPGSEIRGAVRSVYEAAFNGCMSSVSLDRTFSRRSGDPKSPGILIQENGEWVIQPCERAMLFVESEKIINPSESMGKVVPRKKYNHCKEGQEIWIKIRKTDYQKRVNGKCFSIGKVAEAYEIIESSGISYYNKEKNNVRDNLKNKGYVQGWLHKGENFHRKHHESVFYHCDTTDNKIIKLKHSSDIEKLNKILQEYRDSGKNRAAGKDGKWYCDYKVSPAGTLVYYCEATDGHVYLSPACIGREVFSKTVGALLNSNGGYEPCTGEELCPACQIFGMIGKTGTGAAYACGSKIKVTDAQLTHAEEDSRKLFEIPIILPELGEPKPCAVEFYTKSPYTNLEKEQNKKRYWTYDYKIEYKENYQDNIRLLLDVNRPELRGRKFYWHSDVDIKNFKEKEVSAMKQRIRPMKAQSPDSEPLFTFRVYFEQLDKEQLKKLKWALDFGNPDCAHKIGRAKPLGFGSVRITADKLFLRTIDIVTGTWTIKETQFEQFFENSVTMNGSIKTVQLMANWKERPDNVQYPSLEPGTQINGDKKNSTASHQWFTKNKKPINNPSFDMVLPEANEEVGKDLKLEKSLYRLINK